MPIKILGRGSNTLIRDGGYNGIPMNDNWGACFVLAGLGITMFILALYSQELYKEQK